MINQCFIEHPLSMTPEGSLNRLPVSGDLLALHDPLRHLSGLNGAQLMSRRALVDLLNTLDHPCGGKPRQFIEHFDPLNDIDSLILQLYAYRFAAVIDTARQGTGWPVQSRFTKSLTEHWNQAQTLVISGGLTCGSFGLDLARRVESLIDQIDVIASPWGSTTALFGLAQTVSFEQDLLVMDFGATGVKRGIASKYGNRMMLLPDLSVEQFKEGGLIRKGGLMAIFEQTRKQVDQPMPVAISLACYLKNGHPFDYHSGIYHRLRDDAPHLALALRDHWLPDCGFTTLALLDHDSTSAAFAFRMKQPAMMVTLGTGLGSAPCPRIA
ncbi:MAG: hypothetical protein P8X74_20765 [Reinekea sp.]